MRLSTKESIAMRTKRKMKSALWLTSLALGVRFTTLAAEEGAYQAKNFSYLLGNTPGIRPDVLRMHFTLYQGYVKNANALKEKLEAMEREKHKEPLIYGALKRRFAWEMNGMILHELYFENLGSQGGLSPKDPLYQQIKKHFGSFAAWKEDFLATGNMRGIGWVILYQDPVGKKLYNLWVQDHDIHVLAGATVLLVMDVWEHAYLTQYGTNRASYLDAFFQNIRWGVVKKRAMQKGTLLDRETRGAFSP